MIMKREYYFDLKEHIEMTPDEVFDSLDMKKDDVLANKDEVLETLWCHYQKAVEEYQCDAQSAYNDTLKNVLGSYL